MTIEELLESGANITLTIKSSAQKFVGGRRRLEKLISQNKIRAVKTGSAKISRYSINACDVLMYVTEK